MKCIFKASTGLEAHMIANLLQQSGIETRIDGEYLQGGAGGIQAMDMVRVLVNDADYTRAQEVIQVWSATQVDDQSEYGDKKPASKIGVGLLLGLLIGVGITYWAYNSPTTYNGIDYDDDGVLDERYEYRDNRLHRVSIDRNRDLLVDMIYQYNRKGNLYKSKIDDNFDGVFESIVSYKQGNPILTEADINQDGAADSRIYYTDGVMAVVEILDPDTSKPKARQHYKMNKLVSSEFDSNGDGIYDKQYTYDYYEHVQ